jgi:hypothetical protein
MADVVDSLIERLKTRGELFDEETARPTALSFKSLCNEVGLRVALRFNSGTMSWADGDEVMNNVWSSIMNTLVFDVEDPDWNGLDVAIAVFEAFDQGEFTRKGDDRDPADAYTAPLIRRLLEDLDVGS